MRKVLLTLLAIVLLGSWQAMGQSGTVSLIGEFNGWAGDHVMTRSLIDPMMFSTVITVTDADDVDPVDGVVSMKFRENADWVVNWGSVDFPSGTGTIGGDNIPVPPGNYYVTFVFNPIDSTGTYNFQRTSGTVSMIGEFNEWADDYMMMRDMANPDKWTAGITVAESDDSDSSGFVDMKFRENGDWPINWGDTSFPAGVGVNGGPNIPVPYGSYIVSFEWTTDTTCNYNFVSTCGEISIIGEFNGWSGDYPMIRDMNDPDVWYTILTLDNATADNDPIDGISSLKFRMNADWTVNWGSVDFPSGTGVQNGENIPVPLDTVGLTTDYNVMFNCATGAYTFLPSTGAISMIGAFNDWNGDVPMNRDLMIPNVWHLTRSWHSDSEVKFRENQDWVVNWGSSDWPTGIGTDNGPNIPLVAGTYDVTFNANTFEYAFVENNDVCGEIGMVGDFNEWGDDGGDIPSDVNLVRDRMFPSQYSLVYNFTSSTKLFFREDAIALLPSNVDMIWGGSSLCQTGVHDITAESQIQVAGGKYRITFNCESGDYCFERLGNAVIAPEVFTINVDGNPNDSDWNLDQSVSRIVNGTATADVNTVDFGVTWNDTYLYIGMYIRDSLIMPNESGELFVDGDKSGGAYDEHDIHIKFSAAGPEVVTGPDGYEVDLDTEFGFMLHSDFKGYSAEVAVRWADLGVTPAEGNQIGFDVIVNDDDNGTMVDYSLAWNGDLNDTISTANFGDLVLGGLSCGCISLYNGTIGDVILQNPSEMPTTYVGTYDLDAAYDLVFRKDEQGTVTWATDTWPAGTAVLDGPAIPGQAGKVRITFDCLTGEYTFDAENLVDPAGVAMSNYTDAPPVIDGDLSEYTLDYGSEIMVPESATNNNTATWGSRWDKNYLYIGVNVVDAVIAIGAGGNPWQMDAIEFYIDGNNDKDGTYDGEFDTQLIMDVDTTGLWLKADGVQIVDYEAILVENGSGYTVELKLGWADFQFKPGKGRVMGFSLGNNDLDDPLGDDRDYQSVWFGSGSNWNDTGILGDMQLAGGPYFFTYGFDEDVLYNANILLYPNPTTGNVSLQTIDKVFNGEVTILVADISGRIVIQTDENFSSTSTVQLNTSKLNGGIYFVNVLGQDGKRAVKKLIVH